MKMLAWAWWLTCAAGALACLCLAGPAFAAPPAGKGQGSNVIQIDISKLPPELAKQLQDALGKQPAAKKAAPVKTISLTEAIAVAEKAGKGRAVRAELRDGDEPIFKIDVLGSDGSKSKIELTADGKVRGGEGTPEAPAPDKKKREKRPKNNETTPAKD